MLDNLLLDICFANVWRSWVFKGSNLHISSVSLTHRLKSCLHFNKKEIILFKLAKLSYTKPPCILYPTLQSFFLWGNHSFRFKPSKIVLFIYYWNCLIRMNTSKVLFIVTQKKNLGHFLFGYIQMLGHLQMNAHMANIERLRKSDSSTQQNPASS